MLRVAVAGCDPASSRRAAV